MTSAKRAKNAPKSLKIVDASDHDGSSEDSDEYPGMAEAEMQSVVGPSISRAQTRMMSPRTPAAEKTAILAGDGFFEAGAGDPDEDPERLPPETPPEDEASQQTKQVSGDSNVKKYMSGFSLPKWPLSLNKGVSMPTFSSVLGTARSQSPIQWGSKGKRLENKDETESNAAVIRRRAQTELGVTIDERFTSPTQARPNRPTVLRRATSDQSLYLYRPLSAAPSLGDDSRWVNVQEQVNSRMKAIKDSLQDSSLRLPSMPSMPSFNFNPFRPPVQGEEQERTHIDHALSRLEGDLVVLGGYRGSILRSAQPPHRQLWVPVKVGLNIRKVNLEVGLEPEDEERMHESIYASGMLSHIGPVDMGRRLLKRLRIGRNVEEKRLRIHDYGYDWRLSPSLLSRRLIEYLEKLPCNQPGTPAKERGAFVIAHSMGGLITRHAVNQRPELFAGVVYAGVPQYCVNILGPFRNGDDVLLSSKVLTAQVNFSMRSSFVLLPDDGICFVDKESKEEYPVDFYDPNTWVQYALSPCVAPIRPSTSMEKKGLMGTLSETLPSFPAILPLSTRKPSSTGPTSSDYSSTTHKLANVTEASPGVARAIDASFSTSANPTTSATTMPPSVALPYLARTLREIFEFRQQLRHNEDHQKGNLYPPHAIIYASNTPTVCRARVSSRAAIACADAYDDLQFGSGDGVVLARAAQLPAGYRAAPGGRVKTDRGHVSLLGDLEGIGRCLCAVLGERRKRGVGLGLERAAEDTSVQ